MLYKHTMNQTEWRGEDSEQRCQLHHQQQNHFRGLPVRRRKIPFSVSVMSTENEVPSTSTLLPGLQLAAVVTH
jgi:hypothetical protein